MTVYHGRSGYSPGYSVTRESLLSVHVYDPTVVKKKKEKGLQMTQSQCRRTAHAAGAEIMKSKNSF